MNSTTTYVCLCRRFCFFDLLLTLCLKYLLCILYVLRAIHFALRYLTGCFPVSFALLMNYSIFHISSSSTIPAQILKFHCVLSSLVILSKAINLFCDTKMNIFIGKIRYVFVQIVNEMFSFHFQ